MPTGPASPAMHAFEHVVEDARRQSHWPESVLDAARDAAAATHANGTTSSSEVEWTVLAWVTSLPDVNMTLANALLEPLAQLLGVSRGQPCPTSAQLGYIRALGASVSADDIKALLMSGPILESLAQTLHTAATAFREQRAATAAELHDKFRAEGDSMRLEFGGLSTFYRGLEGVIGPPASNLETWPRSDPTPGRVAGVQTSPSLN